MGCAGSKSAAGVEEPKAAAAETTPEEAQASPETQEAAADTKPAENGTAGQPDRFATEIPEICLPPPPLTFLA